jgi:hypothetical protein
MPMLVPVPEFSRVHVFHALAVALIVGVACRGEDQMSPDAAPPASNSFNAHTVATSSSTTCTRKVNVSTVSALAKATSSAMPGDCILLAAGTYAVGVPSWTRSGTATQPITLEGAGRTTVLTLGGYGGIYLRANYWRVRKLRVTSGLFGIQTEGVKYVELDSLEVDNTQMAAINLRYGTNHSVVKNSRIHDTGKATPWYGEGVYIGGYAYAGSTSPDLAADDNQVLNTSFGPYVRAEAIDISAGADRVIATGNTIDGTGTVYKYGNTNSLIGVRGFGHQISDNVLSKGAPHGIAVYSGSATFHRNHVALYNVWSYPRPVGINRYSGTVTVGCDNVVTNIPSGGSAYNVSCTP